MAETALFMTHDLKVIHEFDLPSGYHFRMFNKREDALVWAKIVTQTQEFSTESEAIARFNVEFLPNMTETEKRMIFIETNAGERVGTATAWFGKLGDETMGRLHWVEIIPEYQGKKLGRPLITKAMSLLNDFHTSAYLKTQISSPAAIHLYQQLGWTAAPQSEQEQMIWNQLK